MRATPMWTFRFLALASVAAGLTACGGGSAPQGQGASQPSAAPLSQVASSAAKPVVPPSVSIGDSLPVLELKPGALKQVAQAQSAEPEVDDTPDEPDALVEPEAGTPEWLIREITKLQTAPLDVVQTPIAGKPGEFQMTQLTDDQADAEEMRRAEKIVEHALDVCRKTKGDKDRAILFNNAVHYLASARVTLASFGDHDQVRLMSEEADTLYKLDPKSFGAIETQLKLVECLQELAEQDGRKHPEWGTMASKQARLFASRFPQETNRSALALVSAARACEVGGTFDDARQCFLLLERDFAKTPFAEQAAGAIRRYKMTGQPIGEFAGATIDGGFISIDQFRGRPVLIVFWSAESPSFREDLPKLGKLAGRDDKSLAVIGVNMDTDEAQVDSFLEKSDLPWKTIFFSNLDQRGIRNPLARAYGVTTVPQYWLIDSKGKVVAAPVDLATISTQLTRVAGK